MMTKEQLLSEIRIAAIQGVVTLEELTQAYCVTGSAAATPRPRRIGVTDLLYFLGGAIVFIGIVVLVEQHWSQLSFATKMLATIGSGLAAYYSGLLLSREPRFQMASQAFFLISALVLPVGLAIVFDHFGFGMHRMGVQAWVAGLLSAFFIANYALFRSRVFLLFSVIYGTWLFFSLTGLILDGRPEWHQWKILEYCFLVTGLTYGLLEHAFSSDERCSLRGALYGFGVLFFLGAAFALGGWEPTQSYFWEIVFPGLVLGALLMSIPLKSKSFLTFGSLYLMAYIGKITVEYFKDSLGWPLSLVLIGFALMATGYGAYSLNMRYLRT